MTKFNRAALQCSAATFALSIAMISGPAALAQVAQGAPEAESIVVTGSRIARPDLNSTSPVAVVSATDIALSGNSANIENFLSELPQFVPAANATSNNPGGGLATIDLRGLGTQRTLVLVNGTRFVPSTTGGTVDINNIPAVLIDRVDIVTGGASAVYGSDALAGVVNFVLKRDFEGVQLDGGYRITGRGDAQVFNGNVTVGGNFADGRGNAVLTAGYTKRTPVFTSARAFSNFSLLPGRCAPGSLNDFGLGTVATGAGTVDCYRRGGSTLIPSVNFFDFGQTLNPDGTLRRFVDPADRFNFAPFNYLQIPQERFNFTGMAHFEVNDHMEVYGRGTFAYNSVPTELAPTPIADAFDIDYLNNPFVSPQLAAQLATLDTVANGDSNPGDGIATPFFGRRMLEVGSRVNPLESYAFQIQTGVRGEISGPWRYDAYYQYGRIAINERLEGDVSRQRFQQAITAVRNASGQIVCADSSNGCVPANMFGAGTISPEAADFISLTAQKQTVIKEEVFSANIAGDLGSFLFASTPIGVSFGYEYRSVYGSEQPDEALQNSVLGFNTERPTQGSFNVSEFFGELNVPIVEDTPFFHYLGVNGAARYSNYSNAVGNVWSYSGGVEWAPIRDIRFRGQYQRAVRAPSVSELFAGQGNNFPAATDPCSSASTTQTPAIRAACERSGLTPAQVFNFTQPGGGQVEELIGGNPNLTEETSDTYTVGVVLQPSFLPSFTATVDYYTIEIEDFISTFGGGAANILSTCYGTLGGDPTSPFCSAIERRANGPIDQIVSTNANISTAKFRGIDFQVNYGLPVSFGLLADESRFALAVRGTYALQAQTQATPIADLLDCVGHYGPRCGEPTPKWRLNSSLTWLTGPLTLTLQHRFLSGVKADFQKVFENPFLKRGASFTPSTRLDAEVKGQHYVDVVGSWDVDQTFTFTFGIDNLLGNDPVTLSDQTDEQNNTYPASYDTLGRTFFVAVKAKF